MITDNPQLTCRIAGRAKSLADRSLIAVYEFLLTAKFLRQRRSDKTHRCDKRYRTRG